MLSDTTGYRIDGWPAGPDNPPTMPGTEPTPMATSPRTLLILAALLAVLGVCGRPLAAARRLLRRSPSPGSISMTA